MTGVYSPTFHEMKKKVWVRVKPQFKVRIKGRTFIIFVHSQSGAAFGKFQHTTEKKYSFATFGCTCGDKCETNELTSRLIRQFSTAREGWCSALAAECGSRWVVHHKVSSWVRPKGAAALMLQSAIYTVQLLTWLQARIHYRRLSTVSQRTAVNHETRIGGR